MTNIEYNVRYGKQKLKNLFPLPYSYVYILHMELGDLIPIKFRIIDREVV